MALERTGNGYLVDPTIWSEGIMHEMANEDGMKLTQSMVSQIVAARDYYAKYSSVPPIRKYENYRNDSGSIRKYTSKK